MHFAAGRYEQAITLGESMVGLVAPPRILGRIHYYVAMAYLNVGRPDPAAPHVDIAKTLIAKAGDSRFYAECLAGEVALAQMRQRPDAVEMGRDALAACRRLKPVPKTVEARMLSCIASSHLTAGEWVLARDAAEEGLRLLEPNFDIRRQARLLNDAALAYKELGQLDTAIGYIARAIELHTFCREKVCLARCENNLGLIFMLRGDYASARAHLDRSLALCEETHLKSGRSHLLLSLSELCLEQGDPLEAREWALKALGFALRLEEEPQIPQAHILLARCADALGETHLADSEIAIALLRLARIGQREWLMRCHRLYSEILESQGRTELAQHHRERARVYEIARRTTSQAKSESSTVAR
jgi:tetratricopeptide (TPR) repeat protein